LRNICQRTRCAEIHLTMHRRLAMLVTGEHRVAPMASPFARTKSPERLLAVSVVFVTLGLLVTRAGASSTQGTTGTAPKLIRATPQPTYPAAARAATVEGDVQFRATITPDGTVESVAILRVPQSNLGFEAAVEDAVRQWRFQPAMRDGTPVSAIYVGSVHFELSLPREWIYPASSRETWTQVVALIRDLKFRTQRLDETHQVLITDSKDYVTGLFPSPDALKLVVAWFPRAVEFHVYVAPGIEPARVAIGSVLETTPGPDSRRNTLMVYGNEGLSAWLLAKLSGRMGKTPEPLSASPERRAEQSRRLMPPDLNDPCSVKAALLVRSVAEWGATVPKAVSKVTPIYPKDELESRGSGLVVFEGEITEHGTVTNMRQTAPSSTSAYFTMASQLATSLWRFEPSTFDGCRVRARARFENEFKIK
jgi:TonB family protein